MELYVVLTVRSVLLNSTSLKIGVDWLGHYATISVIQTIDLIQGKKRLKVWVHDEKGLTQRQSTD